MPTIHPYRNRWNSLGRHEEQTGIFWTQRQKTRVCSLWHKKKALCSLWWLEEHQSILCGTRHQKTPVCCFVPKNMGNPHASIRMSICMRAHLHACRRTSAMVDGYCIGHNDIGPKCMGHNYIGHDCMGHSYIGHSCMGHNDIGHKPGAMVDGLRASDRRCGAGARKALCKVACLRPYLHTRPRTLPRAHEFLQVRHISYGILVMAY